MVVVHLNDAPQGIRADPFDMQDIGIHLRIGVDGDRIDGRAGEELHRVDAGAYLGVGVRALDALGRVGSYGVIEVVGQRVVDVLGYAASW